MRQPPGAISSIISTAVLRPCWATTVGLIFDQDTAIAMSQNRELLSQKDLFFLSLIDILTKIRVEFFNVLIRQYCFVRKFLFYVDSEF